MQSDIENVAAAIEAAIEDVIDGPVDLGSYKHLAKAAIHATLDAIREPTADMLDAGIRVCVYPTAMDVWKAMIDAKKAEISRTGGVTDMPPQNYWEKIRGDTHRIAVPGGWIYRVATYGTDYRICFVPHPPDLDTPLNAEAIAEARQIGRAEGYMDSQLNDIAPDWATFDRPTKTE